MTELKEWLGVSEKKEETKRKEMEQRKKQEAFPESIEVTSKVDGSLPLLSPKYSKRVAETTSAQMNARITRLRAAELFLEACAMESTDDSKIPGIVFRHELIANYDGRFFVKTTVSAEKTLSLILKSRLSGGSVSPIASLSNAERKALEEHAKLLNKSVAKRIAVIINPVYFAPAKK